MLRDAVIEAQAFVQSPAALVACSALSALSIAAQGIVNVRRDPQLAGPVSLYLLSVAESGERKTTCDRVFGAALRDWERDRALACATELAEYETATASYEAKKAGLLESIKRKRRDAQDPADDDRALVDLKAKAPTPVSVPRLLHADATPEALAHALATGWPSAAVLSAEAGAVFGAHGTGYETILRNLALLNVLWDGGEISVDRRSKPSFRQRDRRLTFGVKIQPEALRGFIERAGALPRGSGFIARFLIAWPASTQGHRPYRRAPQAMPAVDVFSARVRALLDTPLTTDAQCGLAPTMLDLSAAAHSAWVQAHDRIERQLGGAGHYASIRDVAAKAAENIARLAALLHVLDHGPAGEIDERCVESASRIIDWHLHEARRLLARSRCAARTVCRHPLRRLAARRGLANRRPAHRLGPHLPVRPGMRARQQGPQGRARPARRTRPYACGAGGPTPVRGGDPGADRRLARWGMTPGRQQGMPARDRALEVSIIDIS
ncbi:MAG: YfjI family protein [Burkholderiales bacterium]